MAGGQCDTPPDKYKNKFKNLGRVIFPKEKIYFLKTKDTTTKEQICN